MLMPFNLPLISDDSRGTSREMKEVKNYLYKLTDQLRYILANLDGDNFSGELKAELNNTAASLKASCDRLSGEVGGAKQRLALLEQSAAEIACGTAAVSAGTDTEITFGPFSGIPAVTACYNQASGEDCFPLTVHSVTAGGAKIGVAGSAPLSASVRWLAVYQNQND